jgi:hypothetical protein
MDLRTALNICRSNGLLNRQERAHFEHLAIAYKAEHLELRQQIEETKARERLPLLESKAEEAERGLSVSKALSKSSPIRRIPPELLSLVFELARTGEKLNARLFKESTPPTLLALARPGLEDEGRVEDPRVRRVRYARPMANARRRVRRGLPHPRSCRKAFVRILGASTINHKLLSVQSTLWTRGDR